MLYGAMFVVELCLVVYCTLNVITTPEGDVRNLPKLLWLLIVLLFPIVGGIAWLVAGRPLGPPRSLPYKGGSGVPTAEPYRRSRAAASPDDDEAFLRGLRERAEQQRRDAQRRREQEEPGAG